MKAEVTIPHGEADSNIYWNLLKNLSFDVKLDLISKLSASLIRKDKAKDTDGAWVAQFVGKWQDARSADEIVADIRDARTNNREIELNWIKR